MTEHRRSPRLWAASLALLALAACRGNDIDRDPQVMEASSAASAAAAQAVAAQAAAKASMDKVANIKPPAGPLEFGRRHAMPELPSPGAAPAPATRPDLALADDALAAARARVNLALEGRCSAISAIAQQANPTTAEKYLLGRAHLMGRGVAQDKDKGLALLLAAASEEHAQEIVQGLAFGAGFFAASQDGARSQKLLAALAQHQPAPAAIQPAWFDGLRRGSSDAGCSAMAFAPRGPGQPARSFVDRLFDANGQAAEEVAKRGQPLAEPARGEFETSEAFAVRRATFDAAARAHAAALAQDTPGLWAGSAAAALQQHWSTLRFKDLAYDADQQHFNGRLVSDGGEIDLPVRLKSPADAAEADKALLAGAQVAVRGTLAADGEFVLTQFSTLSIPMFVADGRWSTGFRFGPDTEALRKAVFDTRGAAEKAVAAQQAADVAVAASRQAFEARVAKEKAEFSASVSGWATLAAQVAGGLVLLALAAFGGRWAWMRRAQWLPPAAAPQGSGEGASPMPSPIARQRQLALGGVAAGVLAVFGIAASPYLSLWSLKGKVMSGDGEAVAEMIDYPSLRESIKGYMAEVAGEEMQTARREGGFAGAGRAIGAALGAGMASALIDSFVTPQGVRGLIAMHAKSWKEARERGEEDAGISVSRLRYRSWGRFEADVDQGKGRVTTVVLSRSGLFGWKVSGVRVAEAADAKTGEARRDGEAPTRPVAHRAAAADEAAAQRCRSQVTQRFADNDVSPARIMAMQQALQRCAEASGPSQESRQAAQQERLANLVARVRAAGGFCTGVATVLQQALDHAERTDLWDPFNETLGKARQRGCI